MWLIPGKTKIQLEIFKNVGVADILLSLLTFGVLILLVCSNFPHRWIIAGVILFFAIILIARVDEEPNYMMFVHMLNHLAVRKHYSKTGEKKTKDVELISAFTGIKDGFISYGDEYYGAVLEITPVNFRLFTRSRKNATITNGMGMVLRNLNLNYGANIVKIDRPVHYGSYVEKEFTKLEELRKAYETAEMSEEEFKSRAEIIYERIDELYTMDREHQVVVPFYYVVLFDSDMRQLDNEIYTAQTAFSGNDIHSERLYGKDLALFLKYSNSSQVDESELDSLEPEEYAHWAMPDSVDIKVRSSVVENIVTHTLKITDYPMMANDAWLASVMSVPGTKVVLKCCPMDMDKAIRNIDRSLNELQAQLNVTGIQSKAIELNSHIESLSQLLVTLKGENEILLSTNVYVTAYDLVTSEKLKKIEENSNSVLPRITNMKKTVRRTYSEQGLKVHGLDFEQFKMFVASQVSGYDPYRKTGRSIPTNSVAACYPWVFATISDESGVKLGSSDGVPVFMDFFKRDTERVNSNMVIVGKSGSGKSFATKGILANLAADNAKIFILDPENEYSELAGNLHGKFINVGNAQFGRLNPFHIMTALDDDEENAETVSGSFATHLQFLEEFFIQIMPDCDREALEYLNVIVERMYLEKGINAETNLSLIKAEDYPVFDDLYDSILKEFQQTDNQYVRSKLRTLINYVSKFAAGGRNANIWNGPSTITTEENLTVFNFQSLLSNRNSSIANAQMLLVLKYVDNEIIKNRDYNLRFHANRKIAVVIDEAHVFIDTKFPVALDFMFQLAKRIRKYNGMQIVITQNIKDFVGSEEIARKSTAIINASQYSLIFSLAPNDLDDLCTLYEKAGGINEVEQEVISTAPRGLAFAVLGPLQRTTFHVEIPDQVVNLFSETNVEGKNFSGEEGAQNWAEFLGDSAEKRMDHMIDRYGENEEETAYGETSHIHFAEMSEDEARLIEEEKERAAQVRAILREQAEEELKRADEAAAAGNPEDEIPEETPAAETGEGPAAEPEKTVDGTENASERASEASKTDALLAQILQSVSSDNISMLVEKAVAAEVARQMAELKAQAPAAEVRAEAEKAEETPAAPDTESFDTFRVSTEEAAEDTYDIEDAVPEEETTQSDEEYDFLKLLNDSIASMKETSAIEQMELYDEETADITLEDLEKYLSKH